jgi:broad specificity phosphatase PhoE
MTELILARHGETAWNLAEVFRGQSDIDLNENGVRQAELIADHLRDRKIEAVYCSPLMRARKTAATIASRHNLQPIVDEGLNDLNFGDWQGLNVIDVQKKYPTLFAEWEKKPHLVKIPGGETLVDAARRALATARRIAADHDGTVVLVSHRVVLKVLILGLLGLDVSHFWHVRIDTGAMTTFVSETAGWCLTEHNNTSYLKPLRKPRKPPGKDF